MLDAYIKNECIPFRIHFEEVKNHAKMHFLYKLQFMASKSIYIVCESDLTILGEILSYYTGKWSSYKKEIEAW